MLGLGCRQGAQPYSGSEETGLPWEEHAGAGETLFIFTSSLSFLQLLFSKLVTACDQDRYARSAAGP